MIVWIVFRDGDVSTVHARREDALVAANELMRDDAEWEEYPGTHGAMTWEGPRSIGLEGYEVLE